MSESGPAGKSERIALGRIVRAQGLRGAVRVLPYGLTPELGAALVGKRLFLRSTRQALPEREITLESERWHSGVWIVELAGCVTRDAAEALVGWELCLPEEERPALGPDEFYADELVGLRVVDSRTGDALGEVVNLVPQAAADLLEVERADGRRFLIPSVRALVKAVDLPSRTIRVDLPEGLMEVNE